jgi:hypothetical protein
MLEDIKITLDLRADYLKSWNTNFTKRGGKNLYYERPRKSGQSPQVSRGDGLNLKRVERGGQGAETNFS